MTWNILGWSGEWAYEARKTERSKGIEAAMSNPASFHEAWPYSRGGRMETRREPTKGKGHEPPKSSESHIGLSFEFH